VLLVLVVLLLLFERMGPLELFGLVALPPRRPGQASLSPVPLFKEGVLLHCTIHQRVQVIAYLTPTYARLGTTMGRLQVGQGTSTSLHNTQREAREHWDDDKGECVRLMNQKGPLRSLQVEVLHVGELSLTHNDVGFPGDPSGRSLHARRRKNGDMLMLIIMLYGLSCY
jgi:hypothetical protein